MAYTRRQGTTTRTASTGANKVVAAAAIDEALDETEQGQEELEEDDADDDAEEEEEEEKEPEEEAEEVVVAAATPITAPAPANALAPAMELGVPTGTPVQIIHQCNHALTGILEELLADAAKSKRLLAIINGNAPVDESGKRPGDYWWQSVNHYQGIKRQATNALVAQAMKQ